MIEAIARALRAPQLDGRRMDLDFVRGVAILLACGWHFNQSLTGIDPLDWALAPGRRMGWAGVDLFFVLSGFLIGGLLFSEFAKQGGFRAGRFLIRRAFKIWPVLYGFLLLQLVLDQHPWQAYFFQCLFHIQNYLPTPLSHLWSLAVEEQFYLIFAGLYAVMIGVGKSPRLMPWVLGALMVVPLLARSIAVESGIEGSAMMQTQYRIDALACGVALSYMHCFHRRLFDHIASRKWLLALVCIAGCSIIWTHFVFGDFMKTIGGTITYLSAAAFILFCYDLGPLARGSWPARQVARIGLFSYAIYVCQYAAVKPAALLAARLHLAGTAGVICQIILDYAGACLAGVLVTLLVERPMLALRERLLADPRSRRDQPPLPAPGRAGVLSTHFQPAETIG